MRRGYEDSVSLRKVWWTHKYTQTGVKKKAIQTDVVVVSSKAHCISKKKKASRKPPSPGKSGCMDKGA